MMSSRGYRRCEPPDEIIEGLLYLGGFPTVCDEQLLKDRRIVYIMNAAPSEVADSFEGNPDFEYIHFDLQDAQTQYIEDSVFEESYAAIEKAREENVGIVVHCFAGVSRSATIVIAYLMRAKGMSLREARDYTKERRAVISPNPAFMRRLGEIEVGLFGGEPSLDWRDQMVEFLFRFVPMDMSKDRIRELIDEHNGDNDKIFTAVMEEIDSKREKEATERRAALEAVKARNGWDDDTTPPVVVTDGGSGFATCQSEFPLTQASSDFRARMSRVGRNDGVTHVIIRHADVEGLQMIFDRVDSAAQLDDGAMLPPVSADRAKQLLSAAQEYGFSEIAHEAAEVLMAELSVENASCTLQAAELSGRQDLREFAKKFIVEHFEEVKEQEGYTMLEVDLQSEIVEAVGGGDASGEDASANAAAGGGGTGGDGGEGGNGSV